MIPGLIVRGKPHLREMTALDALSCADHADDCDPFRGPGWVKAFRDRAKELGYRPSNAAVCHCPNAPHRPECGLVSVVPYPPRPNPVHYHFATDDPADGIAHPFPPGFPVPVYPPLTVYEDVDGMHRHQCPDCGTVWEHSDDNSGIKFAHTCPGCGCYKPGAWFLSDSGEPTTYDGYYGHRAPDYSERFQNPLE